MQEDVMSLRACSCGILLLLATALAPGAEPPATTHHSPLTTQLHAIDGVVQQALERAELPGCVILVVHKDLVVFRKAYGLRAKEPKAVAMTADTLFDLASLTKPIATATSLMILMEQGKLCLADRVAQHLPAFGQ